MSLTDTKSAQAAPSTTDSARESRKTSVIAGDLEVIGDLKGKGEIQIEGKVKGEVRSKSAIVSPGAEIDGTIVADAVEVARGDAGDRAAGARDERGDAAVVLGLLGHEQVRERGPRRHGGLDGPDALDEEPALRRPPLPARELGGVFELSAGHGRWR